VSEEDSRSGTWQDSFSNQRNISSQLPAKQRALFRRYACNYPCLPQRADLNTEGPPQASNLFEILQIRGAKLDFERHINSQSSSGAAFI